MNIKLFIKIWLVYFLLVFPLFYFVYKYGTPNLGLKDFNDYYKMYKDWDIEHTEAPFNMRLVSSFFVYILNKAGLHYTTETSFDATGLDKQVFFNAVFFNFLCVVTTSVVIFKTVQQKFNDKFYAFLAGILYPLGFGTIFYELMPLTDALSVLLFSLTLYWYIQKKYLIIIPLILLILQREYVFLALGLINILDYWKYRHKYFIHILIISVFCFATYFILRKTLFYTVRYDQQTSPEYFLESLFQINFPLVPFLKQTLMTMNLFILYVGIVVWKKWKRMETDKFELLKLLLLFLQINLISFAAVFGNNTGRYFYILVPLVIYQIANESRVLLDLK